MECKMEHSFTYTLVVQNAYLPVDLLLQTKANILSFECLKSSFLYVCDAKCNICLRGLHQKFSSWENRLVKNGFRKRNKPCKSCSGCVWNEHLDMNCEITSFLLLLFLTAVWKSPEGRETGQWTKLHPFPLLLISFAPMQGIYLTYLFNNWVQIKEKKKKKLNSYWCSVAIPKENKLWVFKFLKQNLWF